MRKMILKKIVKNNNKIYFSFLIATMSMMLSISPVFASTQTNMDILKLADPVVIEKDDDVEEEKPKTPLTPSGNLTLVDDINSNNDSDKQFITVISKNGNYFYLIIDRANDEENVYFLNMVDEYDLLQLIEEIPEEPEPVIVEPTPEPVIVEPTPEPVEEESSSNPIIPLLSLLLLGGGGAYYYFNFYNKETTSNNKSDGLGDEDDDYDDDYDEYDLNSDDDNI